MGNNYFLFKKCYKALSFVIHVTKDINMVTSVTNYEDIVTGLTAYKVYFYKVFPI